MKVRRVVTGHDKSGQAVFASDEVVEQEGLGHMVMWGSDSILTFPDDGAKPSWSANYPAVGGFRFSIIQVPAGYDPKGNPASAPELTPEQLAMMHAEPGHERSHMQEAGFHWTESIDLEIILSGELILELDNGQETLLRQGDTIVQNGTRHRWRNVSDETAVFLAFLVGANHNSA